MLSPDVFTGLGAVFGAAGNGKRLLAFEDRHEHQSFDNVRIIEEPSNAVLFDAISIYPEQRCYFTLNSASPDNVLLDAFYQVGDSGKANRYLRYVLTPPSSTPALVFDRTDSTLEGEFTISSRLWASNFGIEHAIHWHDLTFATEAQSAWTSPDGRIAHLLRSVDQTLFFSTMILHRDYGVSVWDPAGGTRAIVSFSSVDQGGACCLQTDGADMIWYEATGWQQHQTKDQGDTFTEVWLVTSPFATQAANLKPRRLRRMLQDFLQGGGSMVGGGFAITWEGNFAASGPAHVVITRLSDGAFFTLTEPPGYSFANPLYIDHDEFAGLRRPAGTTRNTSPVVLFRRSIASLGPFQAAGGPHDLDGGAQPADASADH